MAQHLGVVIIEKDQSKSAEALPVTAGAMAVYAPKGPTDKAYLCQSEDDLRRLFGQPPALMTIAGSTNYCRGLHNAFGAVRAGLPMWIMRAIPSVGAPSSPVKALKEFQSDGAGSPKKIKATALGHGLYYNDIVVVVGGIETVNRKVTLPLAGTEVSLEDNVLPRTLVITEASTPANTGNDTAYAAGAASTSVTGTLARAVTVTYEDSSVPTGMTAGSTTLAAASGATDLVVNISYERTTQQHVIRLYIALDSETDPKSNYLETFLVSTKEAGTDEAGNAIFIEDVVNGHSEIIEIQVANGFDETKLPYGTKPGYSDIADYTLTGGTDGTYAASDADIKTALQEFRKKSAYDILYMVDAAYSETVKVEMAKICQARIFPVVYIDPPENLFVENGNKKRAGLGTTITESQVLQEVSNWRKSTLGMGAEGEWAILAGSVWGKVVDEFNGGRKLWVPPTWDVFPRAIYVDNVLATPWQTVAGPRRGVTGFPEISINLYDYRDQLNAVQVNPLIIDERGVQMYYGNKTLKPSASAMQQAHARKCRGRITREFYFSALSYVMEGIVESTFNDIRNEFEDIIKKYSAALESYSLVVGPPKTTSADIANQILRIGVGLIFINVAEEIEITTTVYKNGADLSVIVL